MQGKLDDTEAATALDTLMEWAIFEDVDSKDSTIYRIKGTTAGYKYQRG